MKRNLKSFITSRKLFYPLAIVAVIVANVNALVEPVYAQAQYIMSRQQSVIEQHGRWDTLPYESPVRSIHAALMNTGKVLLIAGSGNDSDMFDAGTFRTVVWNPADGSFKEVDTPWDVFCAGHAYLPDGKLLIAGGTKWYENLDMEPRLQYAGLKDSYIFDPATESYQKVDSMDIARWYPTLVGLDDGKVLAVGGLNDRGKMSSGETEIFDPATKQWTMLPELDHVFPTYPSLTLMNDGRLFYSGSNQGYVPGENSLLPGIWNLKNNDFQYVTGLPDPIRTDNSASVLLPPAQDQKVMLMGGARAGDSPATETTNRTALIDLDSSTDPKYIQGPNLKNATRYPSAVILPDDTVLQTGGSSGYRGAGGDLHSAQIYHPDTNTLTDAASPMVGRNYHSEAILLPDGRVAVFGSDPLFGKFEMRIEIYSPSYLFRGERPSIIGGDTELTRGMPAGLALPAETKVNDVKLVRPSAVTHVTDVEQRSVDLPFKRTPAGVDVDIPASAGLLPSGWYMAYVTNDKNIPSLAYWVHVK